MKKIVALFLVLAMMIACVSAYAAGPSFGAGNLGNITVDADGASIFAVNGPMLGDAVANYQDLLDIAQIELEKLAATEKVTDYFGAEVALAEKLGTEELNVFEFSPVVALGFDETNEAEIAVELLFATPYEPGEAVQVLLGTVTVAKDGTQTVEWTAYNGVGMEGDSAENYGKVQTSFDLAKILEIQGGVGLLAIVSK